MSGLALRWSSVLAGYGRQVVLHGVTLAIPAGGCVALLGRNGAGKTTLARTLVNLVRTTSGLVEVGDWEVAHRRPDEMARRVGYAFQRADQQLFARTVREDVAFGPRQLNDRQSAIGNRLNDGQSAIGNRQSVDEVLAELQLSEHADRHPYDLPPPLRKMVSLAGVLAMETPVLVLDEPTAGLDDRLRELVVKAVRERGQRGVTVLMITHDLRFLIAMSPRRVSLEYGRIVDDSVSLPG